MSPEAPLKIGLVTGEFPPMQGGVGDYTHALASALAALNAEVHVITSSSISRSGPPSSVVRRSSFVLRPIIKHWSFPSLLHLRRLARSLKLDLLNIQYQAAAYGLSAPIHFLPQVAGIKTVVTFHDLRVPYLFPKAGKLREAAVTHLARTATGVIANDPADEVELRRRGIKRVIQIPIGSNIAPTPPADYDRAAWRAQMGVAPQEFLIGYFGFLNESKGGDTLIGALAALTSRKARVKLVLIGGETGTSDAERNAAFNAEIERLIARYDLTDRVIRTGFVTPEAVSAYLLACEAIVLPYRDGVSFRRGSLMAALAHGCAIVTTHPATPLPELQDGANVRLIPPDSASAIVLAVTELLNAPDFRARLGQGAQKLSARFSWEGIARRTLEFYRSL
jgi:glycosyltransferase involved in cell wall biosynthesis